MGCKGSFIFIALRAAGLLYDTWIHCHVSEKSRTTPAVMTEAVTMDRLLQETSGTYLEVPPALLVLGWLRSHGTGGTRCQLVPQQTFFPSSICWVKNFCFLKGERSMEMIPLGGGIIPAALYRCRRSLKVATPLPPASSFLPPPSFLDE